MTLFEQTQLGKYEKELSSIQLFLDKKICSLCKGDNYLIVYLNPFTCLTPPCGIWFRKYAKCLRGVYWQDLPPSPSIWNVRWLLLLFASLERRVYSSITKRFMIRLWPKALLKRDMYHVMQFLMLLNGKIFILAFL